tara:strand:- start:4055 stop:4591 length:537 start_codon:yes stop_codon:yes gene_type:complete
MKALLEVNKSKVIKVGLNVIMKNIKRQEFSFKYLSSFNRGLYPNDPDSVKQGKYIDDIIEVINQNEFNGLFEFKNRWLHHSIDEVEHRSNSFHIISWPVCEQLLITRLAMIKNQYDLMLRNTSINYQMPLDTVNVSVFSDPFYDATHLSKNAVSEVTNEVKKRLAEDSTSRIFVINFR